MENTRANAKRNEEGNEDQEVPLHVPPQDTPQAPHDPLRENVTDLEFRSAMQLMDQVLTAQANREVIALMNLTESSTTLRVREFIKIKPLEFLDPK